MRDDDDFGHYVPVLRRIIILVAVITAIPVVLWTITAFVRTYISAPKIPTFHQLAASASTNAPSSASAKDNSINLPRPASEEAKKSAPVSVAVEARTTATDAHDAGAALKGPLLGDHVPEDAAATGTAASPPAMSGQKTADLSPAALPAAMPAEPPAPPTATTAATPDSPPTSLAASVEPSAAASAPPTDTGPVMAAATPLTAPIPLPRHRPHIVAAAETAPATPMAQTTRMASNGPVPMPRPRPDAAGPSATAADSASGGPLEFIQNLFGGK
jgi:hypothetical protein